MITDERLGPEIDLGHFTEDETVEVPRGTTHLVIEQNQYDMLGTFKLRFVRREDR